MKHRITDKIREDAGIEAGDPLEPVCDMIDRTHARIDGLELSLRAMVRSQAIKEAIPDIVMAIRGWIWRALIVALLLLMMALYLIADHIEQRDEVQLSEQKRDLNTQFEARVDQRAHEIAAFAIQQHDEAREAAQAIIDQKSGDPDVRATVGALFDGTRGDLLTVWQILKNTDPRTSILSGCR